MNRAALPLLPSALFLALLLTGPVAAETDADQALAATAKLRAAMPAPGEKLAFTYDGDLQIAGEEAGSVYLAAEATEEDGKPVWLVSEDVFRTFGGSRSRVGKTLYLAQDLTLLRGTVERRAGDRFERLNFDRKGDGFEITRTASSPGYEPKEDTLHAKAPKDATTGLVAMILFLRALPNERPRELAFPWFAAEDVGAAADEHAPDTGKGPARLDVGAEGKFGDTATSVASFRRGQHAFDVHVQTSDRTFLAVVGRVPPVNVVPKGTAGERTEADAEKPAKTWRAAFLKFGHGYHMAVRPWVEAAFHWQTMYDHETGPGNSWPKEKPLEEFKKAWVDEFITQSKRRTREEADELLAMTLATGKVVEQTDDLVVFAAHPSFGGGTQRTYHLRRIDGAWFIVRID